MTAPAAHGPRRVVAAGLVAFLALGAAQGLYGPLIPELRHGLGVTAARAGLVVSVHFAGVVLGMGLWSLYGRRRSATTAAASLAGLALGALVIAVAGGLAPVLAAATLVGLCTGALNVGFNSLFARLPGPSGRRLSALSGCFAVGAVLGPAAAGLAGGTAAPFVAVAVAALATLPLLQRAAVAVVPHGPPRPSRRRLVAAVAAIMILYVALEASAGSWAATHLMGGGAAASAAAFWTAAFWGALAAGRLLTAWLLPRADPVAVILVALALAVIGAGALFGSWPEAGYVLLGLAIAPVFPMSVAWLVGGLGVGERLFAGFFMVAQAAPVAASAAIGVLVDASGPAAVSYALAALLAAALITVVLARRWTTSVAVTGPR